MTRMTLEKLAIALNGTLQGGPADTLIAGLQNDTRALRSGELFFAIPGTTVDGHAYLAEAKRKGACGAVVSRSDVEEAGLPLIRVGDIRTALLHFAAWRVSRWPGRVVGITGSSGKTTTKEFAASLLSGCFNVFHTPGNFNNTLGVPLALYQLDETHEVAVLEMGMSSPGEIAALCQVAPPDIAVVTNVGSVHLEFFPDRPALARAKAEIVHGLKPSGTLVYNRDDDLVREMELIHPGTKISFGQGQGADVHLVDWRVEDYDCTHGTLVVLGESHQVRLPMAGGHYLLNLAAAIGVCLAAGMDQATIFSRIGRLHPLKMRGTPFRLVGGIRLIDDSYNSNPEAMTSVLDTLRHWEGRPETILVAGEMRELGSTAPSQHRQVGEQIARTGCALLLGVAGHAIQIVDAARLGGITARFHPDVESAAADLLKTLRPGQLVLVKGSRGVGLDKLVNVLIEQIGLEAATPAPTGDQP